MRSLGRPVVTIHQVNLTTTGTAGNATATGKTDPVNGMIVGWYFDFHASAPNTTDTTVKDLATGRTLLTLTNTSTDAYYLTEVQASGNDGAAITGIYGLLPVSGEIQVSLAQCDALTNALLCYIWVMEG